MTEGSAGQQKTYLVRRCAFSEGGGRVNVPVRRVCETGDRDARMLPGYRVLILVAQFVAAAELLNCSSLPWNPRSSKLG